MKVFQNIIPSFDTNRIQLGKALPLNTPFTVILDSSEVCNFRCNYCFRSESNKDAWGYAMANDIMDMEMFKLAISQIQQFPETVRQISLSHQGEPLVNKNLPSMIRYIKEQGIKSRVSIHTNGSLLTRKYIKELAESGLDRVIISLQGLTKEKYKEVCGYDIDFESFYANLKYFYQIKKNTQICIKVIDVALDKGEEEVFYDKFSPISDRIFVEKETPIWKEKNYSNLKNNSELAYNKYGMGFEPQKICPLIFHTIVVLPNRDVYPCTQLLQKEVLGNICEKSLPELWNGNVRKNMLLDQCTLRIPDICKDCGIRQNTIYTKEDMLDDYKDEILFRLREE